MAENTQEKYKYFAFISYSHKNTKEAKWVQEQLERFRLPAKLRKRHPDLPGKLSPVFRDTTDFNTGDLQEIVEENLRQSKYLIVICSPESAASIYVDREVQHFLSLGREKQIIPYIIDGVPGDDANNCYPPSLKTSLIGANAKADGRWKAFIRVVATMTGVSFDLLWRREYRRRRIFWINRGIVAAFVAVCLMALLWYTIPHRNYYRTVTVQYGYPVGIGEVSVEQRKHLNCYYRITTQLGQVEAVECLNSAGELTSPNVTLLDGASKVIYADSLNRVEYYDSDGILRYIVSYSTASIKESLITNNGDDLSVAIDYLHSDGGTWGATTLAANSGSSLLDIQDDTFAEHSGIVRKLQTYNADGYVIREMYMLDNRNTPGMDSYGNYGVAYTYNALGQTETETFLDRDGNPQDCNVGYSVRRMEYNSLHLLAAESMTNLAGEPAVDDEGIYRQELRWSDYGNPAQITLYGTDGELLHGDNVEYAAEQIDYDEHGFAVEYRTYGADRKLTPSDGVCVTRVTHDATGNMLTIRYFDADGEPVMSSSSGDYGILYSYSAGSRQCTGYSRLDKDGEPAVYDGVYYTEIEYNENGLTTGYIFQQADGSPALSTEENTYRIRMVYNGNDMTEYWFLDADGEPMLCFNGACLVKYAYDNNDNLISWAAYGLDMEPVDTAYGYSSFTARYNDQGQVLEQAYYNAKGELTAINGTARYTVEYDELAQTVAQISFNENNVPTDAILYTYTAANTCHIELITYSYDTTGGRKITHTSEDGTTYVEAYDADDVLLSREYDDADGNERYTEKFNASGEVVETTTVTRVSDNDIVRLVVDSDGDVCETTHYTADHVINSYESFYPDGTRAEYQLFNSAGQVISNLAYDLQGTVTSHINTEYDASGRIRKVTSLGANGSLLQYSSYSYADDGSCTVELFAGNGARQKTTVYNADGKPTEEINYTALGGEESHLKREYDTDGRESRVNWFDSHGAVTEFGVWSHAEDGSGTLEIYGADRILRQIREFSAGGQLLSETVYDLNGRLSSETLFADDGNAQLCTTYTYTGDGSYSVTETDADGKPLEYVVYDLNDHITEQIEYEDGTQSSHIKQEYDTDGRLCRIARLNADGTLQSSTEIIYTEDGSCTAKRYTAGGILTDITRYTSGGEEIPPVWPPV